MIDPRQKTHPPQPLKDLSSYLQRFIRIFYSYFPTLKLTVKQEDKWGQTPFILLLALLSLAAFPEQTNAKSRYVTIKYANPEILKEFNDNLRLNQSLSRAIKRRDITTREDEVYAKVDAIVEKVEVVLDMFPNNLKFDLVIVPTRRDVIEIYKKNYGKRADHIAYYSLSQKTIYISADDSSLKVLAHEIGHMVVDLFFQVRPPYHIHELLAQLAEKQITD